MRVGVWIECRGGGVGLDGLYDCDFSVCYFFIWGWLFSFLGVRGRFGIYKRLD